MRALISAVAVALSCATASAACEGRVVESPDVMASPICVPAQPQRIVSLDTTYSLGMGLELGLPIVGAPLEGMSDEKLKAEAEGRAVANLGHFTQPSPEQVIAAGPDLIIGSGFLGEAALQLASRIAPTALITAENWKDYLKTLIEVTGSDRSADEILRPYEERVAAIRARVPGTPVSVVRITSWDFQVYLDAPDAYAPFAILHDAGVRRTDYETSDSETLKRPDWEELRQLQGGILLYIVGGANNSDTNGRLEEVLANPLWQSLPAVKAGRAYRVDPATWMEFSGVDSAMRVLDDIERYIVGTQ